MGYRSVVITNPATLTFKNNRLVIETWEKNEIPLEDIRCLMLESSRVTLTSALIARLGEAGVAVYACDGQHLPRCVFQPVNSHSRQLKQLRLQLAQTLPAQKRLWRQIVQAKIANQARCLAQCGQDTVAEHLRGMVPRVRAGDPDNLEGQAAARYFKALFGKDFTRTQDNAHNAVLNFGYAVFRGYIARTLAVYGLEPCLGIHHASELNNFNLADDLLEPFRPLVDLYSAVNTEESTLLTTGEKAALLDLTNTQILSGGEKHAAAYAVERLVQSLLGCYNKQRAELLLPELLRLKRHEYA